MNFSHDDAQVRRQVWLIIGAVMVLYGFMHLSLGSLPQDLAIHQLADTRTFLGIIPHAGDVLTNLAILAAGLFGLALRTRMTVAPEARAAVYMLIAASILTAFGSVYYHWAPSNAALVWDRIPITLVLMPLLVLVMADRMHPLFARLALWPFTALGAASAMLWGVSEAMGQGDVRLYFIVRIGTAIAIAGLLILRQPRHTGTIWLVAALVCEIVMAVFERLDHDVFGLTGGLVSGHNVKHLMAGVGLAFVFSWLRSRKPLTRSPHPNPLPVDTGRGGIFKPL